MLIPTVKSLLLKPASKRLSCFSVVCAQGKWYDHLPNALLAEAYACRDVVQMAINLEATHFKVKTDCRDLAQNTRTEHRALILPILKHNQELSEVFVFSVFLLLSRPLIG